MNSREAEERLKYMFKNCYAFERCEYFTVQDCCGGCREAVQIAAKRLGQEEQQRWIPIEERLPEKENGKYLVTIKYEHLCGHGVYIRIMGYCAGTRKWYSTTTEEWIETGSITAWMPLPEPYQKGLAWTEERGSSEGKGDEEHG